MNITKDDIFIKAQSTEVNMVIEFIYKEAVDWPTVLILQYVIYIVWGLCTRLATLCVKAGMFQL